jgi:hypothetical protein
MAAKYDFAGDNGTKKPVPIEQFPGLSRKVVTAFVIT